MDTYVILSALLGCAVGIFIGRKGFVGLMNKKKNELELEKKNTEKEIARMKKKAKDDAEHLKSNKLREGKNELNNLKNKLHAEVNKRKNQLIQQENSFKQKESNIKKKRRLMTKNSES